MTNIGLNRNLCPDVYHSAADLLFPGPWNDPSIPAIPVLYQTTAVGAGVVHVQRNLWGRHLSGRAADSAATAPVGSWPAGPAPRRRRRAAPPHGRTGLTSACESALSSTFCRAELSCLDVCLTSNHVLSRTVLERAPFPPIRQTRILQTPSFIGLGKVLQHNGHGEERDDTD